MEESQKIKEAILQEQKTIARSLEEAQLADKDLPVEVMVIDLGLT